MRTTKNWIDHTLFKSKQINKYGRPYTVKIGTIMKMGGPFTLKVENSFYDYMYSLKKKLTQSRHKVVIIS